MCHEVTLQERQQSMSLGHAPPDLMILVSFRARVVPPCVTDPAYLVSLRSRALRGPLAACARHNRPRLRVEHRLANGWWVAPGVA